MEVRNIKVFKSEPIVVDTGEEQIVIKKVPAMATVILYDNEELINKLFEMSKYSFLIANGSDNPLEKIDALKQASKNILEIYKTYETTLIDVLSICLEKSKDWIKRNLGYNETIQIVMAILLTVTEESSDLIKKNKL